MTEPKTVSNKEKDKSNKLKVYFEVSRMTDEQKIEYYDDGLLIGTIIEENSYEDPNDELFYEFNQEFIKQLKGETYDGIDLDDAIKDLQGDDLNKYKIALIEEIYLLEDFDLGLRKVIEEKAFKQRRKYFKYF